MTFFRWIFASFLQKKGATLVVPSIHGTVFLFKYWYKSFASCAKYPAETKGRINRLNAIVKVVVLSYPGKKGLSENCSMERTGMRIFPAMAASVVKVFVILNTICTGSYSATRAVNIQRKTYAITTTKKQTRHPDNWKIPRLPSLLAMRIKRQNQKAKAADGDTSAAHRPNTHNTL